MSEGTGRALRVGLIGAGLGGWKHLGGYRGCGGAARLVAVCDVHREAAAKLAGAAGVEAVYEDAEKMIREAAIDAVDICTPQESHAALAVAAAEAGKHVLVEKPMATRLSDCRAMVRAAEGAGVSLMVAMNERFKPNHRAIRRAIEAGEIGQVRAIRLDCMMNVVEGVEPTHWVYDGRRAGGGVLLSLAVQRLDLARYFAGEIRRVWAVRGMAHERFAHGAEDTAAAMMEFDGGAVGELFASFTPYAAPWGESVLILGEKGTIHSTLASAKDPAAARICSAGRSGAGQGREFVPLEPVTQGLAGEEMFANMIAHFVECCGRGEQGVCGGGDGLMTMHAVFAMYESARGLRAVEVPREQGA